MVGRICSSVVSLLMCVDPSDVRVWKFEVGGVRGRMV